MALRESINHLAKTVALVDRPDASALGELRAALAEVFLTLEPKAPAAIGRVLARALERVGAALDGKPSKKRLEEAYHFVVEVVDFAQLALEAETGHGAMAGVAEPGAEDKKPGNAIDPDLLLTFLAGCTHSLEELERLLLEVEDGQNDVEHWGAIRRISHTVKGESGVLSLQRSQELWHCAEDLVDRRMEAKGPPPIDELLAVIDWMRRYVTALQGGPDAAPPEGHAELEQRLRGAPSFADATSAPRSTRAAAPLAPTDSVIPVATQGPAANAPAAPTPEPAPAGAANPPPERTSEAAPAAVAPQGLVSFRAESLADETLPDFLTEGRQHLTTVEATLLEMSDGNLEGDAVDRIFRAFHTIKGVAGFLNLEPIVRLAHQTETLLDEFRKGRLACKPGHVDLILASNDMMGRLFELCTGHGAVAWPELTTLVERVQAATKGQEPTAQAAGSTTPALAPEPAAEVAPAGVTAPALAPAPAGGAVPKPGAHERKAIKLDSVVNVSTLRLDALVDMVGELVIAQQMIAQDQGLLGVESKTLQRNLAQVAKITRELQQSAMSLRMVTLKPTFQKMARLARDVGGKSGKLVKLTVNGEDTELDRNVVEEIGDPLVHLIRNAIDHGLERAEDRVRAGKDPTGNLTLNAFHQGGSIVIEVRDDGRGLNRERIIAKARERGLISPDQRSEDMLDAEVFKLIFLPGFSTAEKVTDISGRGVGMDVVRRNIEALRGKIEIASTAGHGSVFTLRLPLTLAIIDGMVVRVGHRRYVIPTLAIVQSFRPTEAQTHSVLYSGSMVEVRDQLVPVLQLDQVLESESSSADLQSAVLVLVETNATQACLAVDEILGQQQVVIKNLGKAIPKIPSISGGAILGDGRVAPILDIDGLLSTAQAAAT